MITPLSGLDVFYDISDKHHQLGPDPLDPSSCQDLLRSTVSAQFESQTYFYNWALAGAVEDSDL